MPKQYDKDSDKLGVLVAVRFRPGVMELLKQAALQARKKNLSEYIRDVVIADAERRTTYEEEPF